MKEVEPMISASPAQRRHFWLSKIKVNRLEEGEFKEKVKKAIEENKIERQREHDEFMRKRSDKNA